MSKYLLTLIVSALSCVAYADNLKEKADSAYLQEKYDDAIALYDSLAAVEGSSVEVYYNLGNCYYKLDDMARAVLNYERALLLSPGDEDIRVNLELARSKTIDKIVPHHEVFLVTWWRSFVNLTGADLWSVLSIVFFVAMLALVFMYLFASSVWLQKSGFYGGFVMLLCCIVTNICAWQQSERREERSGAIVMSSSAVVRSTPSASGTDLFVLHEGTRVDITDNSMREWKEIVLADGKKGWISTSQIERI